MIGGFLRRLRDALGPGKRPPDTRSFFVDDDILETIEVLPASAADWCRQQIAAIAEFSARHEAPGGAGWTDVYLRPAAPATIAELAIPFAPTVAAIGCLLTEFDAVITGSFENPQPVRARAFGPSPLSAIVVYHDGTMQRVQHIAVTLRDGRADAADVLAALAAVPSPVPLMIANWGTGRYARLDDASEVSAYLAVLGDRPA